jgi:hypothetical protein
LITAWISGRAGVRRLFASLLQWRIGITRWLLVLLALPVLTVAVAAVTGTLENHRRVGSASPPRTCSPWCWS